MNFRVKLKILIDLHKKIQEIKEIKEDESISKAFH